VSTTTLSIVVFILVSPVVTPIITIGYDAYHQQKPGQSVIGLIKAAVFIRVTVPGCLSKSLKVRSCAASKCA